MYQSKAALRALYAPLIAAYLANGGTVERFNVKGQRIR
jgi:hypothetical protein